MPGMTAARSTARPRPGLPPIPALLLAMVSIQGGAAFAKTLFPTLGAAGTTTLRVTLAAALLVVLLRPKLRALTRAASEFYGTLAQDRTTEGFRDRMLDFEGLNRFLGTSDVLARGKRYEGGGR